MFLGWKLFLCVDILRFGVVEIINYFLDMIVSKWSEYNLGLFWSRWSGIKFEFGVWIWVSCVGVWKISCYYCGCKLVMFICIEGIKWLIMEIVEFKCVGFFWLIDMM